MSMNINIFLKSVGGGGLKPPPPAPPPARCRVDSLVAQSFIPLFHLGRDAMLNVPGGF